MTCVILQKYIWLEFRILNPRQYFRNKFGCVLNTLGHISGNIYVIYMLNGLR